MLFRSAPYRAAGKVDAVDFGFRAMMNLTADFAGIDRPRRTPEETVQLLRILRTFGKAATLGQATGDREAIRAEIPEPNAMTLATISKENRPSTRPVLIKGYDEQGIVWYTNYESRKGIELSGNPWAALQFHWVELERVVRIEGRVEKISEKESDEYFKSRPFDHRIGAWASPQSQVIPNRDVLVAAAAK